MGRGSGDDFDNGAGSDFQVHISHRCAYAPRSERLAAGKEMQATVAGFIKNDGAFVIENEEIGRCEMLMHPISELLNFFRKCSFSWNGLRPGGLGWHFYHERGRSFLWWQGRRFRMRCGDKTDKIGIKPGVGEGDRRRRSFALHHQPFRQTADFNGIDPLSDGIHER